MQAQKRSWIYGGIAHPPNVVLVRPGTTRRRLPAGSSLLLAGDQYAWGLGPFLSLLCRDADVSLTAYLQTGDMKSWGTKGLLKKALSARPNMVLISLPFDPKDHAAIDNFAQEIRRSGATPVWLRPPHKGENSILIRTALDAAKVPSFHSEALDLPRGADGEPSARGYAGWAGALWRWIG